MSEAAEDRFILDGTRQGAPFRVLEVPEGGGIAKVVATTGTRSQAETVRDALNFYAWKREI